jgi:hypothetical protein
MYFLHRIKWLLEEKDERLRHFSMKLGDGEILRKEKSGALATQSVP